jgi:DNA-binding HxlR family transcriptional regulator
MFVTATNGVGPNGQQTCEALQLPDGVHAPVLGGKWKTVILCYFKVRPLRYADLRKLMPKLSDKVLSQRLRELVDAGLVSRKKADDGKAELYALAARAQSLSCILKELYRWGNSNAAEFGITVGQPSKTMDRPAAEPRRSGKSNSIGL